MQQIRLNIINRVVFYSSFKPFRFKLHPVSADKKFFVHFLKAKYDNAGWIKFNCSKEKIKELGLLVTACI